MKILVSKLLYNIERLIAVVDLKRKLNPMKKAIILFVFILIAIAACQKPQKAHRYISPAMKAAFGYNIGSYWIYRDSTTGKTDSFYVYHSTLYTEYHGTDVDIDVMDIAIKKYTSNPDDSEMWFLGLIDSSCSISFLNAKDTTERTLDGIILFTYPFEFRNLTNSDGDTAYLTTMMTLYQLNGTSYPNTIISYHKDRVNLTPRPYSDYYYISEEGILKLIFNHPKDSVHRVLELVRHKIVK